ncbi:cyanovirin-N homolog [Aspergillus lentulus]|uniref:Cyanovirin-N homolog n=1 Tax=Aspergillus lentulus TaxID=293939 RepID=A0ABQ1ACY6_ASPLE|nr:cyanovirin-N homolog [Aspergillus lentulus]GFF84828.1 cyanovirin-N homolog [Aspergillus lentulus]GFG10659.1 cyanovirin-N homolog [Aspergillus lentulus]
MSFHQSSQDIHIRQEDGCTLLLANVRDSHGQLIQRKIRLDDHIGNTDGWFIWGGTNFTRTARNISLEHTAYGPKLCAELQTRDGGWSRGLQGIMLSEKIANNDGHLKFLGP